MYCKKTNTDVQKQFIMLNYEFVGYHFPLLGNVRFSVSIIKCQIASIKWRFWFSSYLSFDASCRPGDLQTRLTNGVSREDSQKASIWGMQNERFEHQKYINWVQCAYGSGTYLFSVTIIIACYCLQIVIRKCKNNHFVIHLYLVIAPMLSWLRFCIREHNNSFLECKFCFCKSCIKTWHFNPVGLKTTFETVKFESPNA